MNTNDRNTLSWLEDFRLKFEAIGLEAENQVLSAADGVINLCTNTMEDLLPPVSDDPMTPEHYPTLCLGHNYYPVMSDKAEMIIMRHHLSSAKMKQNIEIGSKKSHGDELVQLCKDDDHTARECKMCNQTDLTLETVGSTEATLSPIISSPGLIIFDEHKNGGYMSDSDESNVEDDEIESNGDDKEGHDVVEYDEIESNGDDKEGHDVVEYDEIESNGDDKEGHGVLVSEPVNNLSLNESCVLVNAPEPFSTARVQGKQRSYKKKIMDLFNLRRCSSSKNQVQQEDIDSSSQESAQNVDSVSIESEWEIL